VPASASNGPDRAKTPANESEKQNFADHRSQVIWEFIASEEKYIQCLKILHEVYIQPLQAKANKGSDKLNKADASLLFSNVEAIYQFHCLMLPALKTCPEGNVAAVLQKYADYLKMYTKYVSEYQTAMATMSRLSKNPAFIKFIKKQSEQPAAEGLDITSYMIMPVQRVPRYLLLLRELQKYTPSSHAHFPSIEAAMSKISKIASHINEQTRSAENAMALVEIQNQIHGLPEELKQLFQPHRKLLRHGLLTLLKQENTTTSKATLNYHTPFMIVLFNDLVLYTTSGEKFECRGWIPLPGCMLNRDTSTSDHENTLELIKPKDPSFRVQRSLRLQCPSEEEANKWAQSFKEAIEMANEMGKQDAKRKMRSAASISWTHKG